MPGAHRSPVAPAARRRHRRRPAAPERHRGRTILLSALVAVAVCLAGAAIAGGILFSQAQDARGHLTAARTAAAQIADAVRDRDPDRLRSLADTVSQHVHAADAIIDGPLWTIAADVPMVGPNVDAVRSMTRAATVIDDDALPPGLDIMTDLSTGSLSAAGAGIDLTPLRNAQQRLPQIAAAVGSADDILTGIDDNAVLPEIADAAGSFSSLIHGLRPTLDDLQASLPTILSIVGADGPRSYLVVFQNNAEIRATGGNPSAQTLVHVDNGKIAIDGQTSSATFDTDHLAGHDVMPIPDATRALYETDTWQFPQNYTRTPDFPLTATLFETLWTKATGAPVDGVVSLDPVALAHVLAVTGPVTLPSGEVVSSENAVSLLLRDSYVRFGSDGAASDAFFAQVVESVFTVLTRGQWAPVPMLQALTQGVQEHRILAWMRDTDAQAAVVRAGMSGTFAPDGSDVGLFLNDSSHSKLEYYLASSAEVTCDAAAGTVRSSITMTSSVPPGDLPSYTRGQRNRSMGLPGSTMLLDVLFFAPEHATISSTDPATGDVARWDRSGTDAGRTARSLTVELAAGQTKTVAFTSTYDPAKGITGARVTPGMGDTPVTISPSCR